MALKFRHKPVGDECHAARVGGDWLVEENPECFAWRTETYEFVDDPIAIDLLCGSAEASGFETRVRPIELIESWKGALDEFREVRSEFAVLNDEIQSPGVERL